MHIIPHTYFNSVMPVVTCNSISFMRLLTSFSPTSLKGVALLPFIDEARLMAATTPILDQLTEDEKRRWVEGTHTGGGAAQ